MPRAPRPRKRARRAGEGRGAAGTAGYGVCARNTHLVMLCLALLSETLANLETPAFLLSHELRARKTIFAASSMLNRANLGLSLVPARKKTGARQKGGVLPEFGDFTEKHNAGAERVRGACGWHRANIAARPETSMTASARRRETLSGPNAQGRTSAGCTGSQSCPCAAWESSQGWWDGPRRRPNPRHGAAGRERDSWKCRP